MPHTSIPIGTMYCLGRNYERHAREMGVEVPTFPVVFLKPPSSWVPSGGTVTIPSISREMHHELELVVVLGSDLRNAGEDEAAAAVMGYAVGIDFTLRDVQARAKERGEPWAIAKGFAGSAPVGPFTPASQVADPHALSMRLTVNGEMRQEGTTADMILTIPRILSTLSTIFALRQGDLIYTGTPEGVGPVLPGDLVRAEIDGLEALEVTIRG